MNFAATALAGLLALCAGLAPIEAIAQIKPMASGALSHNAPQMRKHGSGLYRPNRPHYHHHRGHPGYRHPHLVPDLR